MKAYILYVDKSLTEQQLSDMQNALFHIKGVQAIFAIHREFEIYGLRTAIQQKLQDMLMEALLTE